MDRRQHERHVVKLPATITEPAIGAVAVYTRDLSRGGAFVLLARDQCPPVGSAVTIRLPGTLWGEKESTLSARVVRVTDEGMALQFFDFDFA
jgi:hypothetical protein